MNRCVIRLGVRRIDHVTDRLEAGQGIVVQFPHVRSDDDICRIDQQCIAVGGGARNSLGSDHRSRPRPVFHHHGYPLRPANLLRQHARQDVAAASRRERNDDFDRSCRLRPRDLNSKCDGKNGQGGSANGQIQRRPAEEFHHGLSSIIRRSLNGINGISRAQPTTEITPA